MWMTLGNEKRQVGSSRTHVILTGTKATYQKAGS